MRPHPEARHADGFRHHYLHALYHAEALAGGAPADREGYHRRELERNTEGLRGTYIAAMKALGAEP